MDITPLIPAGKKIITSYGGGIFKINEQTYNGGVIIINDSVISWPVQPENITLESLSTILENQNDIELLIIGCGTQHLLLQKDISHAFREKGISVEIMTTGAACRTYNVLLGEERKVAAALITV